MHLKIKCYKTKILNKYNDMLEEKKNVFYTGKVPKSISKCGKK